MTQRRRVVVTGAGSVNPLGLDVRSTLEAFANGACAIGPLDLPDIDRLRVRIGATAKSFDPNLHFSEVDQARFDCATQFALVACREAVAQSELMHLADLEHRAGVILGTAGGGHGTVDESYRAVYAEGRTRVHPMVVPKLMHNAAAAQISIELKTFGPCYTVSTACASSSHAMGHAFRSIRHGFCDVIITGGADAMVTFGGIKAWEGLRVLSEDGCRPFDASRNGMVLGEGAGIFVFEDLEHALARGATILFEVLGFSESSDAHNVVVPSQKGAVNALRLALDDAGLQASNIGYVNAHGTGTRINDTTESAAMFEVFGDAPQAPVVSSTKSMHGHLMGASGAVEFLACLSALRESVIPPTLGYETADAACPMDYVPNSPRKLDVDFALSSSFAFGGMNAVMVLGRA